MELAGPAILNGAAGPVRAVQFSSGLKSLQDYAKGCEKLFVLAVMLCCQLQAFNRVVDVIASKLQ